MKSGHIPALDGIRGLAVVLVLIFHFAKVVPRNAILDSGWIGVDLFFALSGFLITGILLDSRGSVGYLRTFWIRRARRIFPLYYLLLAITGAGIVSWLYLNNWFRPANPWLGHTWSLAVEEQFYLIWPLVIGFSPRRRIPWICIAVTVGSFMARVVSVVVFGNADFAYSTTVCRMDGLALGALAAWLYRDANVKPEYVRAVFLASLFPITAIGACEGGLRNQSKIMHIAGCSWIVLAAAALVLWTAQIRSSWPWLLRQAG